MTRTSRAMVAIAGGLALLASACSGSSGPKAAAPATSAAGAATTASTSTTGQPGGAVTTAPEGAIVGQPRGSSGCTAHPATGLHQVRRTLEVDGQSRWYLLSTPGPLTRAGGAPQPLPLVVEFHGLAEGATIAAQTSRFDVLGAKDHFITAFPNGTGTPVSWHTSITDPGNMDFTFVRELLAHLEHTLCVDESRIYATGLSDGAIMSSSLACLMSTTFAAVAPVSGILFPAGCKPKRSVPILAFHGTADPILPFDGSVGQLGAALAGETPTTAPGTKIDLNGPGYPANVAKWAAEHGCGAHPTDHKIAAHVIERDYACPKGAEVEFLIILGGGHSWPGSVFSEAIARITGPTNMEIDATAVIWKFFQSHQLPA